MTRIVARTVPNACRASDAAPWDFQLWNSRMPDSTATSDSIPAASVMKWRSRDFGAEAGRNILGRQFHATSRLRRIL
ncbi:hypothetical protein D3C87_1872390 [compost metagenome]